ncbi:MAG TPA: hypothetical protein VFR81_13360 [Longimicrobium sp.]|nr:hypothetical protein [Longimicrobium sp.]
MAVPSYEESVFINCPFDPEYRPNLHAIVFTVHDCGFVARCALEDSDAAEVRIAKINRIIRGCRLGIHDISRTEPDASHGFPRFNMPLELGLFLGAKEFGDRRQKAKRCLIFEREKGQCRFYCSDLAGQDMDAHGDDVGYVINAVRDFLASAQSGKVLLPSANRISARYRRFLEDLPAACERLNLEQGELKFFEYATLASEWMFVNTW